MRRLLVMAVAAMSFALVAGCASDPAPAGMAPGTYRGVGAGGHGPVVVEVVFAGTEILSVEVVEHGEDMYFAAAALDAIPAQIVEFQSLAIDVIAGATATSEAILEGARNAAVQAGINLDYLTR